MKGANDPGGEAVRLFSCLYFVYSGPEYVAIFCVTVLFDVLIVFFDRRILVQREKLTQAKATT